MGMLGAFLKHGPYDKIDPLAQKIIIINTAWHAFACLRRLENYATVYAFKEERGGLNATPC